MRHTDPRRQVLLELRHAKRRASGRHAADGGSGRRRRRSARGRDAARRRAERALRAPGRRRPLRAHDRDARGHQRAGRGAVCRSPARAGPVAADRRHCRRARRRRGRTGRRAHILVEVIGLIARLSVGRERGGGRVQAAGRETVRAGTGSQPAGLRRARSRARHASRLGAAGGSTRAASDHRRDRRARGAERAARPGAARPSGRAGARSRGRLPRRGRGSPQSPDRRWCQPASDVVVESHERVLGRRAGDRRRKADGQWHRSADHVGTHHIANARAAREGQAREGSRAGARRFRIQRCRGVKSV